MRSGLPLELHLEAPGSHLGTKIGQDGAKMALCWPTWRLRWPTWHHFGEQFGAFWGSRARSFQKLAKVRKRTTLHHFCLVFEGWRGCLELLGEVFWAILATSWPILADVGFKLGPSWQDVGTKMAKMSQERRLSSVLGSSWVRFSSPGRVRPGLGWNGKSKKRNKYFPKAFPSHPKIDPKTYENRPQNEKIYMEI